MGLVIKEMRGARDHAGTGVQACVGSHQTEGLVWVPEATGRSSTRCNTMHAALLTMIKARSAVGYLSNFSFCFVLLVWNVPFIAELLCVATAPHS